MSDADKTSDHLRYAAEGLEDVRTHLSGAIRNSPHEDFEEIIEEVDNTADGLQEITRELMVNAEIWEESDNLVEEGVISLSEETDDE